MTLSKIAIFCVSISTSTVIAAELEDLFDMNIEQLLEVEVSIASKNKEPVKNTPASVTLFSQQDIENMGISSWHQLLSQVPGFYSMMNPVEGNQSHLVIRGHAQTYANTLLILLNGQRLNDDYTGGINYLVQFMDLADVEKVEVIRGPGSAIYGSNAFSGVINIITKPNNRLTAGLGHPQRTYTQVNTKGDFSDWQLGASLVYNKDNGDTFNPVFDRNYLQTSTKDPRQTKQIRVYAANENTKWFAQYIDSQRNDYYLFRRLRDNVNILQLNHFILGLNQQLYVSDKASLGLSAGYQSARRESLGVLTPQGAAPFEQADFLFGVRLKYTATNLAVDGKYQYSDSLTFNSGLSYSQSQVPESFLKSNFDLFGEFVQLPDIMTFDEPEQRSVLDKKRTIFGGYLQSQWQVNDVMKITSGIRYDQYNDIKNALMPRLAIVYQLDDKRTVKLMHGWAYRAPSLGDLYDEESGRTIGSPELKASEIKTTELVYLTTLTQHQFIATAFANEQINIVGFESDNNGNNVLNNIAANDAYGIELEWVWQPNKNIRLNSSFSHLLKNKTDSGVVAGFGKSEDISAKNLFNFNLTYQYLDWSLNLNGNWRSKVKVLEGGSLWLLNSNIKRTLSDNMVISLSISNVLNKQFYTSTHTPLGTDSNGDDVFGFPGRGRQAILNLTYHF